MTAPSSGRLAVRDDLDNDFFAAGQLSRNAPDVLQIQPDQLPV
ncbi:MAG: hypothetical protein U1D68_01845 [Arthrobacter sp.]|nr:hypothetical protein [Arthrobacter sp.]MDZ4351437.1 hypothetical protein [Arthrobacter sp.]